MKIVEYLFDIRQEIVSNILLLSRLPEERDKRIVVSRKKASPPYIAIRNYKLDNDIGRGRNGWKKCIVTDVEDI